MANNKVLIPLNQSEFSKKIRPCLEKFIPADSNDIILYFVTKPPSSIGINEPDLGAHYRPNPGEEPVKPTLHPIYASQQQDSIRAQVETDLTSITNRLGKAGYNVSVVVGFDKDPVEAILREISKSKIDLVAMSTRARVGPTRFFFKSIADKISQEAKIPVLLIHPHDE